MKLNNLTLSVFTASLTAILLSSSVVSAQERLPREYTPPEQVISFDRQTEFQDAVDIINEFAQEFEDRFIIDRTGYTGTIGLTLPPMHWKDALNYILRTQGMILHEEPDLYEILTREQAEDRARPDEERIARDDPRERRLTTSSREVRINATFFEGNRRALREVGVDWSTLTSNVPPNAVEFIGEDASQRIPSQFDNRFVSVNAAGAQGVSQSVFNSLVNFGEIGAGIEVQALFSAFEADNLGEVLATPSVKVLDGEEGRIQVGEDFSIKQRDIAGNITDQFFSTGTILTVTPQIVEHQDTTFIYLQLDVERSSAQPDPVSTTISKEEATTHTLLLNGESTVIAGLYRTERSEVRRGIPILKDLPGWFFGLKYLFGYNATDVSQSELIVLVQAELEETLPERLARQFQSKRELLELEQMRHREELDFIAGSTLDADYFDDLDDPESVDVQPDEVEKVQDKEIDREKKIKEKEAKKEVRADKPERKNAEKDPEPENEQREHLERYEEEVEPVEMEPLEENKAALQYFTIGGAFQEESRAENFHRTLLDRGYDAHKLYNPETGLYYVAYAGFENLEEAVEFTRRIQRDVQNDAWLSTINLD